MTPERIARLRHALDRRQAALLLGAERRGRSASGQVAGDTSVRAGSAPMAEPPEGRNE